MYILYIYELAELSTNFFLPLPLNMTLSQTDRQGNQFLPDCIIPTISS